MFNKIVVVGRCTATPELRYTPSGVAVTKFTIAVDRSRKDAQGNKVTDFFFVETWRGLAENVANFLDKGKLALVDGEAHIDRWDKDGQKQQMFKIVAENVRFLSPKDKETTGQPSPPYGHEVSLDEDIPF